MPERGTVSAGHLSAAAVLCLTLAAAPIAAWANDGFFQGAGGTLRPIENRSLRVLSEDLKIDPIKQRSCYELRFSSPASYYEGKDGKGGEFGPEEFGAIGGRMECPKDLRDLLKSGFTPWWTAEAVYEIEALEDAPEVQFGFPVNDWEVSGQGEFPPSPGVIDFHTYVDGQEIAPTRLKWLEGVGAESKDKTLGYAWKASFQKGRRYVLRTTYAFGEDMGNFSEAIAEGATPWFSGADEANGGSGLGMIYYLTPLRQWASPPPSRISIVVTLPKHVPMTLAVPIHTKPVCVGEHSLFYEFHDSFPDQDLVVYYASSKDKSLKTATEWDAWLRTLGGGQVEMNCALLRSLKAGAGPALKKILAGRKCRPSCARK
ncbi:MAG: hypothetical protein HZB91_09190 [Elusimicrobia bacterium]|nr:hypothetical protein [Elusimicrobiota bacterium]